MVIKWCKCVLTLLGVWDLLMLVVGQPPLFLTGRVAEEEEERIH